MELRQKRARASWAQEELEEELVVEQDAEPDYSDDEDSSGCNLGSMPPGAAGRTRGRSV